MNKVCGFILMFALLFIGCTIKYEYVVEKYPDTARSMPQTIYIDSDFSEQQMQNIQLAINAWQRASNHNIYLKPVWNTPKPGKYREVMDDLTGKTFMWSINKDHEHFTTAQIVKMWSVDGFVVTSSELPQTTHIVIFKDTPGFYLTVLHELGHMLGLQHTPNDTTVMHPNATSHCITHIDAHQLCSIYKCQPKPECP